MILWELQGLQGVVVGGHNVNNPRYNRFTEKAASEQKVIEESQKKGLTINCKKIECMVVSKIESPRYELQIDKNHTGAEIQLIDKEKSTVLLSKGE